jgi:AraC-like DNA-binding protein
MKTNGLHTSALADDGECLSFHSFPPNAASHRVPGFEILVFPEGVYRFTLAGETLDLRGPQLLLLGPQLERGWTVEAAGASAEGATTIGATSETLAIRWPADLLGDRFLDKNHVKTIGALLEKAALGVRFPVEAIDAARQRISALRQRSGFAVVLELLAMLHELSLADGQALLSAVPPQPRPVVEKKSPMDEAMDFMQANYFLPMTLEEMARKACMTKGSFCRSIRKKTGMTYAETLNEIRMSHICRWLVDTSDTVSEIAYRAGYQNIYHFHRHFKRQKGCTPKEFRVGYRVPVSKG